MFESNQDDKSSEDDQQQMPVAVASIGEQKPDIFKLDVDCFGEVFDWLSLRDLHAFGQTCKRMQQVAGYYFRLTYPAADVHCLEGGIDCNDEEEINDFSDFIENISFTYLALNWFQCASIYAQSKEFKSLKKMTFNTFKDETNACMKKHLSKIEDIEINSCEITDRFYQQFLQYCPNIRRLSVIFFQKHVTVRYNWLLEHFPRLEQLVLDSRYYNRPIDELTTFFNLNSNVQHFATSVEILLVNRHSIMASYIKLDTLRILFTEELRNDDIRNLLNEFYERDIFKRLHLYIDGGAGNVVYRIDQTNCVEKLAYYRLPMNLSSLPFVNLKELYSRAIPNGFDMDAIARAVMNLELVYFWQTNPNQMFPFIRHSRKLKHIGIKFILEREQKDIDCVSWNKEREKLSGARKVAIYVEEEFFLAIKEATQNREFSLIAIKRIDSLRFFSDFYMYL